MARSRKRKFLIGFLVLTALLGVAGYIIYGVGQHEGPGEVTNSAVPEPAVAERRVRQDAVTAQLTVPGETGGSDSQILFGDLHVHTTFSADAFARSLPLMGGQGAHPPADACDFARYCSELDFFALTDHAESMTPRHWQESMDSIRACNAVAGDPNNPDLVAYMGFEWSHVGQTAEEHYGHRNVIFRETAADQLPARPIAAPGLIGALNRLQIRGGVATLARIPLWDFSRRHRYLNLASMVRTNQGIEDCPEGVSVRDLPLDCRDNAETPADLRARLDEWGFESLVIPHGTTWGFYTPPDYDWDKQLAPAMVDDQRQHLIEIYSGHGNSEEYRPFRAVETGPNGEYVCPVPTEGYEPCCWRAGELMRERCGDVTAEACEQTVIDTRTAYVAMGVAGHIAVPGATPEEWGNCGQCQDCFQPSFNYRPGGSAQYILTRAHFDNEGQPSHITMGFMASSDNHSARPGTGYKEVSRREMTEATGLESEVWRDRIWGPVPERANQPTPMTRDELFSQPAFLMIELERQASFFLTGGLIAVHSQGRDRDSIWDAFENRNVYGTSGPRILLWFDYLFETGLEPMGSVLRIAGQPQFRVRAAGDFEQLPGCPSYAESALGADRLDQICLGECYNPSDRRHRIERIEVVRMRRQMAIGERIEDLIDDPWLTYECPLDPNGCEFTFDDPEFLERGRESVYYVRAIQEPTPTINGQGFRCDDEGNCDLCFGDYRTDFDEDCLTDSAHRAWSSPIFLALDPMATPLPSDESFQEHPGDGVRPGNLTPSNFNGATPPPLSDILEGSGAPLGGPLEGSGAQVGEDRVSPPAEPD